MPTTEFPLVSIVIPVYGGWDVLTRCLRAIAAHTEREVEVVIVDDASPDGTGSQLRQGVDGARVIEHEENVGFAAAVNAGVAAAAGRYVCLLNSDAIVQAGWLQPLVDALEGTPNAGAAVPMLLNEDGTIQEAGSVIDSDGWALAIGAGASGSDFEYRFRREVDFGSAACLLIRTDTLRDVGGLDPTFGAGYYEDVDLAFKLRERGLRTIYEPRARVLHLQFGSSSAETARARVQKNRIIFYERWRDRLAERPKLTDLPSHCHRTLAARDAHALARILVIDDRVPHTDRGSGDPRMAKLLLELVTLWPKSRVTLAAADGRDAERYAAPLLAAGIEIVAEEEWPEWLAGRKFHYSAVIVSRTQNAERFFELLRATQPQALKIFDLEALSFRRLQRMADVAGDAARGSEIRYQALRTRVAEAKAIREADLLFSVSEDEADFASKIAPETPVFLLPSFVHAVEDPPGFDARKDIVFFGGFLAGAGSPNEDALLYLVREVMPLVWDAEPELTLHVVGADPTSAVQELRGDRVEVVGYVADPTKWLLRARVHVHPMRFGAGIKLKLLETMAAGLPFVTTTVGAEGLGLGALGALLVNDEPDEIARRTLLLYRDAELWERAQRELLEIAHERFDRHTFRRTLAEAMMHVGMEPPRQVAAARA